MSTEDTPADAGTTDEQEDDRPEREVLDWEATRTKISKRQNERRELALDFGDGLSPFVIRGLDDEEQQEVEQSAVPDNVKRKQRRGGTDVDITDVDTQAVRDTILKFGIVTGPDGFKPHREDHRKALPPGAKDQLVDEIEDLSSLDVVERDQFQEVGSG